MGYPKKQDIIEGESRNKMYLYIETKYGRSYWSQKFKDFGSKFLATYFTDERELGSESCYCMGYNYKKYQSNYIHTQKESE